MKKILLAASSLFFLLTACNQQPTLEGSEFSNDNIIPEAVDSMWMDMKHQIDVSIDSAKNEVIAQIENETGEKLTDDQLAELNEQLNAQLEEKYVADVADGVNAAVKGYVDDVIEPRETRKYVIAALSFLAEGKMSIKIDSETNGDADTQQMDGTYQFDGQKVILSYDNQQDTLVLQANGNELYGRIDENTFSSTLTKTK